MYCVMVSLILEFDAGQTGANVLIKIHVSVSRTAGLFQFVT